jgi:tRNA/tmRNA/rRNA uracil-C5-methylase (TrmA/RlmC/RlmD family)
MPWAGKIPNKISSEESDIFSKSFISLLIDKGGLGGFVWQEDEDDTAFVIEDGQMKASTKKQSLRPTSKSGSAMMVQKIRFRVSAFSFFQTNTLGAQELFAKAASMISLSWSRSTILDLYCGAGTIGLSFVAMGIGKFCIGIELVEDAIRDAKVNAQLNKMDDKSYFVAGKAEVLVSRDRQISDKMSDIGLIIVDPPREWLHKDVVEFLIGLRQNHRCQLLYISCNPVTLARDLDLLVQGGWECTVLQPVDMFPHTHHVEMISVLG